MLGKYNTNVVLPRTKNELVKQINSLGQVEIRVLEPITKSDSAKVKKEVEQFARGHKSRLTVILIFNKTV